MEAQFAFSIVPNNSAMTNTSQLHSRSLSAMARKLYGMLSESDYSVGGSMQWNNSLEGYLFQNIIAALTHLRQQIPSGYEAGNL
jgi:hypothetical protein